MPRTPHPPSPSVQGPEQHFRLLSQEHGKQSAQETAVFPSLPTRSSRYFNNLGLGYRVQASGDVGRKAQWAGVLVQVIWAFLGSAVCTNPLVTGLATPPREGWRVLCSQGLSEQAGQLHIQEVGRTRTKAPPFWPLKVLHSFLHNERSNLQTGI